MRLHHPILPHLLLTSIAAFVVIAAIVVGSMGPDEAKSNPASAARADATTRTTSDGTLLQRPPVRGDESLTGPGTSAMARRMRGEYSGPLIQIDRTGACPRVAAAYYRMREAAERSGLNLHVRTGFRTRTHQARLYRELGPGWAAKPGKTLHHDATELDIAMRPGGGDRIHRWLQRHAGRFGFIQRYSWEPWHWGYVAGCSGSQRGF